MGFFSAQARDTFNLLLRSAPKARQAAALKTGGMPEPVVLRADEPRIPPSQLAVLGSAHAIARRRLRRPRIHTTCGTPSWCGDEIFVSLLKWSGDVDRRNWQRSVAGAAGVDAAARRFGHLPRVPNS